MNIITKILILCLFLFVILNLLNKKENFVAIFKAPKLKIEKDIDIKGDNLVLKNNITAEEICLGDDEDKECIKKNELKKILELPDTFKQSVCLGNNCSLKEQFHYLDKLWPIGAVVAFRGRESDVPYGWRVCDGKNNLPDLRDIFIKGAYGENELIGIPENKDTPTKTYDGFGVRGGENEVQLKIEQTPRHYHFFNINDINNPGNVTAVGSHYASRKTDSALLYTETGGYPNKQPAWKRTKKDILTSYHTSYTSKYGKSQPHNNLPPYYTLLYIIRIDEKTINDTSVTSKHFVYDILQTQYDTAPAPAPTV